MPEKERFSSVIAYLYRLKQRDFGQKLQDMTNPRIVYVTDLVTCSHKRVLRRLYPLIGFRFEPQLVLGDLVHRGLQSLLGAEEGWRSEVEVEKTYDIDGETYVVKGRADLVHYNGGGQPDLVVEIKSARDLPENNPHRHHVEQLQIYMSLLGVDRGLLVYVTPERLVEFSVSGGGVGVEARLRETLADVSHPRYEWECRYCPYRRLCPYAVARS